ncbi:MAG: septal ring lytic transglycosylase RlpA family protein [Geminicoccaceae bacterium]|jgi:rare lipoprotein A
MVDRRSLGRMRRARLVPLVVAALLAGCATAPDGVPSLPTAPAAPTVAAGANGAAAAARHDIHPEIARATLPAPSAAAEVGEASWYGDAFAGRPTASGEPFDPEALTAAHPELPFGTAVKVVNLDNGRHVEVVINDRGPFIADRIIDLSRAAARVLGFLRDGITRVRVLPIGGADSA